MDADLTAWIAIAIIAATTLVTRLAGPEIMLHIPLGARTRKFLEALSSSVIVAIVAGFLARGGLREAIALAVAAMVMAVARRPMLAMIAAVLTAAAWSHIEAAGSLAAAFPPPAPGSP